MAQKGSIRGNQDGINGRNESYTINGRGTVSRKTLVSEVKNEQHDGVSVINVNGNEYVRSDRDHSQNNNINKD